MCKKKNELEEQRIWYTSAARNRKNAGRVQMRGKVKVWIGVGMGGNSYVSWWGE